MIYWKSNHCPNCDKDLTDAYSEYDSISDGFKCPYCEATLGYKSIYAWIGLILLGLGGLSACVGLGCSITEWLSFKNTYINSACVKLEWNTGWLSGLLLGLSMFMMTYNGSYVLELPNTYEPPSSQ